MISDSVTYPPSLLKLMPSRYVTPSSLLLIFTRPHTNPNYPFSGTGIDIDYYISFTPLHFLPALQLTKQTQLLHSTYYAELPVCKPNTRTYLSIQYRRPPTTFQLQ